MLLQSSPSYSIPRAKRDGMFSSRNDVKIPIEMITSPALSKSLERSRKRISRIVESSRARLNKGITIPRCERFSNVPIYFALPPCNRSKITTKNISLFRCYRMHQFGRSEPRSIFDVEQSPGPGDYNIKRYIS